LLPEGETIPKIIHQTAPLKNISPLINENIQKIKDLNPGWEYRFYDDSNIVDFIKTEYGDEFYRYYNRINPTYGAARADLFRYLLMYKVGGVYLDIKSSLTKPLDEIIHPDDRYLISFWDNAVGGTHQGWGLHPELRHVDGGEFQQWNIIAASGHPFLKAVIENVLRNIDVYNPIFHGVGGPAVLNTTGPVAYTLAISPLLKKHKFRYLKDNKSTGLEYSIFDLKDAGTHKSLFKIHYTTCHESIINIGVSKKALNFMVRFLYSAMGSRRFNNAN